MRVFMMVATIAVAGSGAATAVSAQQYVPPADSYNSMRPEQRYYPIHGTLFYARDASGRMTSNSLPSAGDLRQRTRTVFEAAQAQKSEGRDAAACRSMRKAIELDKRYLRSKNRANPGLDQEAPDDIYRDLEAEYCTTDRS
ncbi:hypothetical protein [Asticcacaulis sp. YBE204]|uniref:hypothetical protein n=1 Tax=Asticcacaulis sp. YBE204 TaxID=1282363 RepID=UPI0003C3D9AE|nr:hypothetical protein [Asticcacaulis sp. YBE204]ESQ77814.1 hypothetical protein AEYBE204_16930 [Asticcacaulis sp. YBE204]